jgi:DNA-binding MarR family transcriptional regulator
VAAEPAPSPAIRLWSALVDVYQPVLRDVVQVLERDAGIDSGAYSALAYLERAEGGLRLSDLHALMRVRYSQPGLSRLVQRLEEDGFVERRVDPDDRRGTVVTFTRAGRTRYRRARAVYEAALEEHLGRYVSATEAVQLTAALESLAQSRTP